jgi:hypothetical protein
VAKYLEVLSDLTNETLERQFTDEKFRGLLIPTNFAQRDGTRTEPVGLLYSTSGGLEGQSRGSARDQANDNNEDMETIRTAAAVLRAALVASCLRGALPRRFNQSQKITFYGNFRLDAHLRWTCERFAGR